MKKIYLDNSATTKVRRTVAQQMQKYYLQDYGNPSSMHALGETALKAITKAREELATEIGAKTHELIFTSGATESNNWVLKSIAKGKKIIISDIEHPSISETADYLKQQGAKVVRIRTDREGFIDLDQLEREIDTHTALVSVIHANNVIGTIQDIAAIGKICKKKGVLFHTDAVQSFGKIKINTEAMNVDLLSASAHKIGGSKGVGLLYVREGITLTPLIHGGGQERNLRSGTENVAGIVGFAHALTLLKKTNKKKIEQLRDYLMEQLEKRGGTINGSKTRRIYNNVHVCFEGINGGVVVAALSRKGIYVSTGSACESKKLKEDAVLNAIGLSKPRQEGSIRITLNEETTKADLNQLIRHLNSLKDLRL